MINDTAAAAAAAAASVVVMTTVTDGAVGDVTATMEDGGGCVAPPGNGTAVSAGSTAVVLVTVIAVATTLIVVTVFGNILVIMSVVQYPPLRSVPNIFIVSLAVADLMVAIGVLPLNVVYNVTGVWLFGGVVCKLWLTCDVLCCTASILNLCAIALDRYRAITQPIAYAQKRTVSRVMWTVALVWIASAVISSPPLIGWNDWPDVFDERTPCALTTHPGYVVYSSMGSFYIPLLVMSITYLRIYIATRQRLRRRAKQVAMSHGGLPAQKQGGSSSSSSKRSKKKAAAAEATGDSASSSDEVEAATSIGGGRGNGGSAAAHHHQQHHGGGKHRGSQTPGTAAAPMSVGKHVNQLLEHKQRISLSKERKAAKTLGVIMGVFVVSWLPFFVIYLFFPFCKSCCPPSKVLVNVVTWLGYLNSTVNPIIYTRCNMDFRRSFKKILHMDHNSNQHR